MWQLDQLVEERAQQLATLPPDAAGPLGMEAPAAQGAAVRENQTLQLLADLCWLDLGRHVCFCFGLLWAPLGSPWAYTPPQLLLWAPLGSLGL